jgi:putative transposase
MVHILRQGDSGVPVVELWSRESPLLEVAIAMSGRAVGEALERVLGRGAIPRSITVDQGTEFTSGRPKTGRISGGFSSTSSTPANPSTTRSSNPSTGACATSNLNVHQFVSLDDARRKIEVWRRDYNQDRPHAGPTTRLARAADTARVRPRTVSEPGSPKCARLSSSGVSA